MKVREAVALLLEADQEMDFRLILQVNNMVHYVSKVELSNRSGFVALFGKTYTD